MHILFNYVAGDWLFWSFILFIVGIVIVFLIIHKFISSAVKKGVLSALEERDNKKIDN